MKKTDHDWEQDESDRFLWYCNICHFKIKFTPTQGGAYWFQPHTPREIIKDIDRTWRRPFPEEMQYAFKPRSNCPAWYSIKV